LKYRNLNIRRIFLVI